MFYCQDLNDLLDFLYSIWLKSNFRSAKVESLINKRQIEPSGFLKQESGAVRMTDEARRVFLNAWQKRKQEEIRHPFLNETIEWGLVPHAQSLLLARFLRGDLEEYPPFLWK